MSTPAIPKPQATVRKKAQTLSPEERKALVDAFLALKKQGRYDEYVHMHHAVMQPSVLSYEPRDSNYRNGAHRHGVELYATGRTLYAR